jgi:hypothetical protein
MSSDNYDKKTTLTQTLRVEKVILSDLRKQAQEKGISLNLLVNQIFKNFVDWHAFDTKIGMVPLPKAVILDIFRNLRKDEVIDIAYQVGKNEIQDIILFMKYNIDMESFMEWIKIRMRNSSMQINHIVDQNTHIYTIRHNLCLNWSLYHKIILEAIFKEVIHRDVEIKISETGFAIAFTEEDNPETKTNRIW